MNPEVKTKKCANFHKFWGEEQKNKKKVIIPEYANIFHELWGVHQLKKVFNSKTARICTNSGVKTKKKRESYLSQKMRQFPQVLG